jgi:DNA-binding response OmpR family regulator
MSAYNSYRSKIPLLVPAFQVDSRILIIENDLCLREKLCSGLKKASYKVYSVGNAQDALATLEHAAIDLVLVGAMTFSMDRPAICQSLRRHSDVPILYITDQYQVDEIIHGLELGADDTISQPFSFQELIARVQALLRRTYPAKRNLAIQMLYPNYLHSLN